MLIDWHTRTKGGTNPQLSFSVLPPKPCLCCLPHGVAKRVKRWATRAAVDYEQPTAVDYEQPTAAAATAWKRRFRQLTAVDLTTPATKRSLSRTLRRATRADATNSRRISNEFLRGTTSSNDIRTNYPNDDRPTCPSSSNRTKPTSKFADLSSSTSADNPSKFLRWATCAKRTRPQRRAI